jgi:cardiolipin synthase A/B
MLARSQEPDPPCSVHPWHTEGHGDCVLKIRLQDNAAITSGVVNADWTWFQLLTMVAGLYALSIAVFLVLENRSPQSTFAWLFLMLAFPVGGLVVYTLFGRGWKAFSRKDQLHTLTEGSSLADRRTALLERQPGILDALSNNGVGEYGRLAHMLWASARAPVTLANQLTILRNASEKYPRLVEDMRAASESIHLLYYEWASDSFTEAVGRVLAEKVASGVEVRILYDPIGSLMMLSRKYVHRMRNAGVQMHPYSPLYLLHTISYRSHRKIAVVDGRIGYSGGLNMTEKHLTGPAGFSGWRDTHARVTGEASLPLQAVFLTMWYNTTGQNLFEERYFPTPKGGSPTLPIQVVSAGPDSQWKAIRQSYMAMVALAHRHVYLQSPFLIPDDSLAEVMKAAALAGIEVVVMIAPRGGEGQLAYRAGMTYARDLAEAGVRVLLYQGAYFHAKTVCVDSTICCIGSANMDIRSFSINYETNLVVYDEAVTRELEAAFQQDMRHCVEFSTAEYDGRPGGTRLLDSVMRLCSPLL